MTSSAASDTDSASKRTSGSSARSCSSTARPPPPGRWTSSRTTSGAVRADAGDGLGTSAASPTTVAERRPARRGRRSGTCAWSSTRNTRTRARGRPAHATATRGSSSSTSVPSPGAERTSAVPPSRSSRPVTESRSPRRSAGTASGSKPLPAVADEHRHPLRRHLGEQVGRGDPGVLGRVDQRLPGRAAAARPGRRRPGRRRPRPARRRARGRPRPRRRCRAPARPRCRPAEVAGVVEPRAQLPLLAAGQPADRLRLLGVPLDQREGLQHGVVQVGGDRRPAPPTRTRAARSAARLSSSRRHSGAVARATPSRITRVAAKPLRALASWPVVASSSTTPAAASTPPPASTHRTCGRASVRSRPAAAR